MSYYVIRYIANKDVDGSGDEKLKASGTIQYTREDKNQAEQILTKLYEISANQKNMRILKRTRYTFRCENGLHKYLFKITKGDNKNKEEILKETYL